MELKEPQPQDRRPEGLGALQILPDEIICIILEALSPRDVAKLACVSSVLYIFCNEEPLWMKLCLENFDGTLQYRGSWKETTIEKLCLTKDITTISKSRLCFKGFSSLFLYKRWYRCHVAFENFSFDNGVVERIGDISSEEFRLRYDGKGPVLLTELANDWSAKHTWTLEKLAEKYGEVAFCISQTNADKITMKLKDYVSYMQLQNDEDPLYIFDPKFGEVAPDLLKDYNVPRLFQEDLFDVLDKDQKPPFRWLVLGPARCGASWHVDPLLTSAWNTLLQGRKRWALYPPGRVPPGVTVHVSEEDGDVNIESPSSPQWWLDIYPLLAEEDKPLECTQLPGETIFVPSGWWHCVLNLEASIAVTQNFVNEANFEFVCLDLAPGYRHKGVARAGRLAVEGQLGFSRDDRDVCHMNHDNLGSDRCCSGQDIVYSSDCLSMYLEENLNHYNSNWSGSSPIGQREVREWLHRLWAVRPSLREKIWKGACIALDAGKWLDRVTKICAANNLPLPSESEKLPVGTGSNPVYLIGEYVIKLYVEGGLESAVHCLGAELEFYDLLCDSGSPLINHVPYIFRSGFLSFSDGSYESTLWDGKEVPPIIAEFNLLAINSFPCDYSFSTWNKAKVESTVLEKKQSYKEESCSTANMSVWPYLIAKRCRGENVSHARRKLSEEDFFVLASFLGEQVCNLHTLPLPSMPTSCKRMRLNSYGQWDVAQLLTNQEENNSQMSSVTHNNFGPRDPFYGNHRIPAEWEPFITLMRERRKNVKESLKKWGDSTPNHLIEKVDDYLPPDPLVLLGINGVENGVLKLCKSPTWLHMDIMDDNIQMEPYVSDGLLSDAIQICSSSVNLIHAKKELDADRDGEGNKQRVMHPSYILDFSDLSIGDPVYELIAIYLDVFRGNSVLLKHFLLRYKLPLCSRQGCKGQTQLLEGASRADCQKSEQLSYQAMCYCLLHDDNVMGAIFSIWKELRKASSWEEVEITVWGTLNDYEDF
uniref:JmjC domain-containing protein n=1 Tax=Araucaria cunninghamii TaxID=56994 RepID=A0A0D6R5E3_ARACU